MLLEIRTYRLHPGTAEEFVGVMREQALPLLEQQGIRVVRAERSLTSEDGHDEACLIRAFASSEERDSLETTFYSSEAWRTGPREAILSRIESYHTVVLDVSAEAVDALAT
ncbi:NIPSNAP family protein [Luteipulveratus sp. YIM 133132]|uniref:NIPSNAP family protein n=1 Tax=Luteipulveratus flavus TaxID=3031728 RepID=UPI0023AEE83E|nr:NIPSNAP family protein [Luteipulveratus sp. YIM 133132]MDE9366291.1 NIPSNAP family protein [Luteipulveratus sp. YIM 133132]